MRAETAKLRNILRNGDLPLIKKVHLIQGYVLSKGTFQCATWGEVPAAQFRAFHGCIMGMYRDATGSLYVPGSITSLFSDADVIYDNNLMSPMTMLKLARLSLLLRVVAKSPPLVLELAIATCNFKKSWAATTHGDLAWVAAINSKFTPCQFFSFPEWVQFLSSDPSLKGREVKRTCKSKFANVVVNGCPSVQVAGLESAFPCSHCGYRANSTQQLSLHLFSKHAIKDSIRLYVKGTRCHICLIDFHKHENVLNHVRRGRTPCRRQALLYGPLLSTEEADARDLTIRCSNVKLQRKGLRRHALAGPHVQLCGPRLVTLCGPVQKTIG